MKIVFIGASGLIGRSLLSNLLKIDEIKEITLISRKRIALDSSRVNQIVYKNLSNKTINGLTIQADCFICTLGTTIKKAKTKEAFRKVDLDLVVSFSKMAKRSKASSIHIVSSKGANSSSIFFYNKTKGEMEENTINAEIPSTYLYRPSLLIGHRNELRRMENYANKLYGKVKNVLPRKFKKSIASEISYIIEKISNDILEPQNGIHFIESNEF
jgi:uncharacterized protein YbjT (DUF2867 family)